MRLPRKTTSRWLIVTATIAFLITSSLAVAWWAIDGTTYATGYSEWRFRSVKIGMDEKALIRLLGEPLHIEPNTERIVWTYIGPTTAENGAAMAPAMTTLTAALSGVINDVSGTYLRGDVKGLIGRPLASAKERFGEPSGICKTTSRKVLCYATGPGSRSHFERRIGVDVLGRVSEIIASWYQD
jgi:hypothetical protein